jgi:transcriptional regulator with XRE-family HTH domain
MSVEALAGLLGLSPSWVRMVERGKLNADRLGTLLDLTKALRVDLDSFLLTPIPGVPQADHKQTLALLRTAFTGKDPQRGLADIARSLELRDGADDLMLLVDPGGKLRIVGRAEALTAEGEEPLVGISLATPLGLGLDRDQTQALNAAIRSGTISLSAARSLDVIHGEYMRLSDEIDPKDLLPGMSRHLKLVQALRGAGASQEVETLLATVASSLAQYSGWVHLWALGDERGADRFYRMALRAANDAGDPYLAGFVLGCMSDLASNRGDHLEGVHLAEAAVAHNDSAPWPLLRVDAAATKAMAHAFAGQADEFHAELERVEKGLQEAETIGGEEPVILAGFDEPWLVGHRGVGYALLGDADAAWRDINRALDLLPPVLVRTRSYFLTALAGSLLKAGEAEAACSLAIEAAGLLSQRDSALIARLLADLDSRLARWRGSVPEARELHETLLAL